MHARYSGRPSVALRPLRGAVLFPTGPTLIGSESTRSCSAVNATASVRRICRSSTTILQDADSTLQVITDSCHVLHQLLPPLSSASQHYSLRDRTHQFRLPDRTGRLIDCNFLVRSLYKDVY